MYRPSGVSAIIIRGIPDPDGMSEQAASAAGFQLSDKKRRRVLPFRKIHSLLHRYPFFRSIRMRVFLVIFLAGLIPCMIIRWSILASYETRVVSFRTSEAETELRVLANHLLTYGYLQNPSSPIVDAELTQFASFYDGRVMVIDNHLTVVKDTYGMSGGKSVVSGDVIRCLREGSRAITANYVREDNYIEVVMPISETKSLEDRDYSGSGEMPESSGEKVSGVLLAVVSTDSIAATLENLGRRSTLLMIVMGIVIFTMAMMASSQIVQPFEKTARAFENVQAGYSSECVSVGDYRETENIVRAFNAVIARMRAMDESRQEFVSNVSHELKTPMTGMKVLADSLLQQGEQVPAEMYREFLADIDGELDRENKLIDELLNLAKMDSKQIPMNIARTDINELVEQIMKRVRPIAQQRDVEMTFVSERDVKADIDEVKMTMVFTNLIENAVKYNKDHGKVTVTLDSDHRNFIFTCEDTGIGIPEAAREKIFERFYRVDKSRSRDVGGTGLGLSITRRAVLLHRGTIAVDSKEGKGSKFIVTIPLVYVSNPDSAGAADRARQIRQDMRRKAGTGRISEK